jgi:hypothetical protein
LLPADGARAFVRARGWSTWSLPLSTFGRLHRAGATSQETVSRASTP